MNLDDCIISTKIKTAGGYALVKSGGKLQYHHRVVYAAKVAKHVNELAGYDVRHKCDRPACINPGHLELGTRQDNVNDMIERGRDKKAVGEAASKAKLTEAQVRSIRASKDTVCTVLAAQYGVSHTTILKIWRGETWTHLTTEVQK